MHGNAYPSCTTQPTLPSVLDDPVWIITWRTILKQTTEERRYLLQGNKAKKNSPRNVQCLLQMYRAEIQDNPTTNEVRRECQLPGSVER